MIPDIATLLEIQEIDQQLAELQHQLNRYPTIWDEVKTDLRRKTEKLEAAKQAKTNYDSERKKTERDLRINSEKLKQYQTQQMMVKTSKELSAISAQIDNVKKIIARLEEKAIGLLDQNENIAAGIGKAEVELNEAKARAKKERERIREQVASKKQQIDNYTNDRGALIGKVSSGSLALYERTRNRWSNDPIVPVRSGSCTGCHFALLPNRLVEVHQEESIIFCDHCGRILSHDETFVPVAEEAT